MRFAIYARRSTDDAGESEESQVKSCRELADKRGFTVADDWVITEKDVSGRVSREKLDKIIAASYKRPRPFDGLLIWTISRGARDIGLTLELFESMTANGVQIWRADQGREIPFKTPSDVAMVAVESYASADQPYQTGRAVHRSHRQRAEKGWQVAGREFGYDLVRFCDCGRKNCPERGDDHTSRGAGSEGLEQGSRQARPVPRDLSRLGDLGQIAASRRQERSGQES